MNWEYCSALASNVSSCAFFASGLSFASRFMDLSVAAAACNSTGALVGVVSVAWDWSKRAVTRASSSACSSGSSSIEPAAWRLRWFACFVVRRGGLSTPRYRRVTATRSVPRGLARGDRLTAIDARRQYSIMG